jgi:hypothetical protein
MRKEVKYNKAVNSSRRNAKKDELDNSDFINFAVTAAVLGDRQRHT